MRVRLFTPPPEQKRWRVYAYSDLIDRWAPLAAGRHIRRAPFGCAMANDDRPKALGCPAAHQGGWATLSRLPTPAEAEQQQHIHHPKQP